MPALKKYKQLITEIKFVIDQARHDVVRHINSELLFAYWNIGRLIVEKETEVNSHEKSSREMMIDLSKELTKHLGKGFSRSNLVYMRLFFLKFNFIENKSGGIETIQPFGLISGRGQTLSDQKQGLIKPGQTVSDQKRKLTIHKQDLTLGATILK